MSDKTPIELMQDLISEQINRVQDGIGINTDIALLKDLERLSSLGVLTVYTSSEIPEMEIKENSVRVEYRQPRLMFEGEAKIVELRKRIEELEANTVTKEQHKEDVVNAYCDCWTNDGGNGMHKKTEAEQYYKENYENI